MHKYDEKTERIKKELFELLNLKQGQVGNREGL